MDSTKRRAIHFYVSGIFNPTQKVNQKMNYTYNKPYNAPYKAHSAIGMVGTIASSTRAKRNQI